MLDIAVDTDRAAVNNPPRAASAGGLDHVAHGVRIHRAVLGVFQTRLAINRGDVVHDIDARRRALQARAVAKVTENKVDPGLSVGSPA